MSTNQQQQQKENQEEGENYSLSKYLKSSPTDPLQQKSSTTLTNNSNNTTFNVARYAIPKLGTTSSSAAANNSRPSSSLSATTTDYYNENDTDEEITAEYLKAITGFDELHLVSDVELKVNNKTQSIHLLSSLLPNVVHLRLSRSCISSIRELGTTFTSLRVLWLSACNLTSLNGIQHIGSHLRELFFAFNNIKDVSPLCLGGLNHLEVLDLEGNLIDDGESAIKDLISLSNLPCLKCLNLVGNPFISSSSSVDVDQKEQEEEDEDEEDDDIEYTRHTHQYHKMVLRRIKEVNEEEEEHDEGDSNKNNNTKRKKKTIPLEYLDDTPIEEIQVKVMVANNSEQEKNNAKKQQQNNEDSLFDGQQQQKEGNAIEEEFASARRRLQSRRENENKRNDPLFRTMFDELSLLQNAIRSQLGKTGENLVAEETVRTTSRLMSRQRSLAPEEQKQRVRVATAREGNNNSNSSGGREGSSSSNTTQHQPAPPPQSSKKMMPTPPTTSPTTNENSSSSSAPSRSQTPLMMMTSNPAALIGRTDLGCLKVGSKADITVIDPNLEWTIYASQFLSPARNCPFDGWKVKGKAIATILGGKISHSCLKKQPSVDFA